MIHVRLHLETFFVSLQNLQDVLTQQNKAGLCSVHMIPFTVCCCSKRSNQQGEPTEQNSNSC